MFEYQVKEVFSYVLPLFPKLVFADQQNGYYVGQIGGANVIIGRRFQDQNCFYIDVVKDKIKYTVRFDKNTAALSYLITDQVTQNDISGIFAPLLGEIKRHVQALYPGFNLGIRSQTVLAARTKQDQLTKVVSVVRTEVTALCQSVKKHTKADLTLVEITDYFAKTAGYRDQAEAHFSQLLATIAVVADGNTADFEQQKGSMLDSINVVADCYERIEAAGFPIHNRLGIISVLRAIPGVVESNLDRFPLSHKWEDRSAAFARLSAIAVEQGLLTVNHKNWSHHLITNLDLFINKNLNIIREGCNNEKVVEPLRLAVDVQQATQPLIAVIVEQLQGIVNAMLQDVKMPGLSRHAMFDELYLRLNSHPLWQLFGLTYSFSTHQVSANSALGKTGYETIDAQVAKINQALQRLVEHLVTIISHFSVDAMQTRKSTQAPFYSLQPPQQHNIVMALNSYLLEFLTDKKVDMVDLTLQTGLQGMDGEELYLTRNTTGDGVAIIAKRLANKAGMGFHNEETIYLDLAEIQNRLADAMQPTLNTAHCVVLQVVLAGLPAMQQDWRYLPVQALQMLDTTTAAVTASSDMNTSDVAIAEESLTKATQQFINLTGKVSSDAIYSVTHLPIIDNIKRVILTKKSSYSSYATEGAMSESRTIVLQQEANLLRCFILRANSSETTSFVELLGRGEIKSIQSSHYYQQLVGAEILMDLANNQLFFKAVAQTTDQLSLQQTTYQPLLMSSTAPGGMQVAMRAVLRSTMNTLVGQNVEVATEPLMLDLQNLAKDKQGRHVIAEINYVLQAIRIAQLNQQEGLCCPRGLLIGNNELAGFSPIDVQHMQRLPKTENQQRRGQHIRFYDYEQSQLPLPATIKMMPWDQAVAQVSAIPAALAQQIAKLEAAKADSPLALTPPVINADMMQTQSVDVAYLGSSMGAVVGSAARSRQLTQGAARQAFRPGVNGENG